MNIIFLKSALMGLFRSTETINYLYHMYFNKKNKFWSFGCKLITHLLWPKSYPNMKENDEHELYYLNSI
jgi:hypothetical protein